MRRKTIAALAVTTVALAALAPAQATVRERWNVKKEPYAFTFEECGFPIEVEGVFNDLAIVREGKDPRAFPVVSNFSFKERWTNVETGEWFTISSRSTFVETSATHVDGSIFEFRFVEAGQPRVYRDSDGDVVERNSGSVHGTYWFDTGGDEEPGGEPVEGSAVLLKVAGPHPSLDSDDCEIASALIG